VNGQRRPYAGSRVVLGVTGGIASYKSAWLARLLVKAGAEVDVVMTSAAREFIGAITFEALTGRRVHSHLFEEGRALDHIGLARAANAIVVASLTVVTAPGVSRAAVESSACPVACSTRCAALGSSVAWAAAAMSPLAQASRNACPACRWALSVLEQPDATSNAPTNPIATVARRRAVVPPLLLTA